MNEYLIIIPAYNEERNLPKVLESLIHLRLPFDILVVNDGSKDKTEQVGKRFGVSVVSHPTNLGYGTAIQTGYRFAAKKKYPYIIFFDADGQHDSTCLLDMMTAIKQESVDVVIGSRFMKESSMKIGFLKGKAIQMFRKVILKTTKTTITDPTSGLRSFKYHVYKDLAENFPYDYPDSNFIIETLLNNHKIIEIPVNMYDREHGEGLHTGYKPIIYMIQILLSIFIIVLKSKLRVRRV